MIGFSGILFANQVYFTVQTTGSTIFKLYAGNTLILNEIYFRESLEESVIIQLEDVISEYVRPQLPDPSQLIYEQPAAGQIFRIDSEGFYDDTFRIIGKKIALAEDKVGDFLEKNFLTYNHSWRKTGPLTPCLLSYYTQEDCRVRISGILPDQQTTTITFPLNAEKVYTINATPHIIRQILGKDITNYNIFIETLSGRQLSEKIELYISELPYTAEIYLYVNEMGGFDTFICTGDFSILHNLETTINTLGEKLIESNRQIEDSCKQNTGYLTEGQEVQFRDFIESSQRFHIINGFPRAIVLKDVKITATRYALNSAEFEFRYKNPERIVRRELPEVILPMPPYPEKLVYCLDQIRNGTLHDRITGKQVTFGKDYIDFSNLTEDPIFDRTGECWSLLEIAGGKYHWPAYNFDYAFIKEHSTGENIKRFFYHTSIGENPRTVYPILVYASPLTTDEMLTVLDYMGLPHNLYDECGSMEDNACSLKVSVSFIVNDYSEVILKEAGFYAQIGEITKNKIIINN